jgi:hypothetical protein
VKRLLIYVALLPLAMVLAAAPGKVLAWGFVLILLAMVILFASWGYISNERMRREKAAKTYSLRFVYIEEDGSPRALTPQESELLDTEFHPADGARPYIKAKYAERTPDGRISGFLPRRKLPRHLRPENSLASRAGDA